MLIPIRGLIHQGACALVFTLSLAGDSSAQVKYTGSGTGASNLYEITAPLGEFQAENHIMTNLPAAFNGANVNGIVGANAFYTNGITGQSAVITNVEGGHVWNAHETLTHVTNFSNGATAWDDPGTAGAQTTDLMDRHATWVGMLIGGRNGGASQGQFQVGIAPGADLRSGAIASSWNGAAWANSYNFNFNSFATPYNAAFGTAHVINSSWGFTDPTGTNFFSIALDGLADNRPSTTFVTSAGNSGPGANTVGSPGSGYNSITVGALANDGANNYAAIAGFSSRGPQDYSDPLNGTVVGVRAAVDISAPGTNLTSAFYGGTTGGNNPTLAGSAASGGPNFYSFSVQGTSFASPIVAGGAGLLNSASLNTPALAANPNSRDARVVKAILLNSADKVPGWNNGQIAHPNGNGGVLTLQALDYTYGAGAMNLDEAYDNFLQTATRDLAGTFSGNLGLVDPVGWDFGVVVEGLANTYTINTPLLAGSDFTLTLSWFRDRDWDGVSGTVFERAQVDLDLRVIDTATNLVISESLTTYDLVEHLHFSIPATSTYRIEVEYAGEVFDTIGTTQEQYGIAWSATAVPEPASTALALTGLVMLAGARRRR
jgi:hypothetical protein